MIEPVDRRLMIAVHRGDCVFQGRIGVCIRQHVLSIGHSGIAAELRTADAERVRII